MFKQRVITALALAPVVFAAILIQDTRYFSLLSMFIIVVSAWEWSVLCRLPVYPSCLYSIFLLATMITILWLDLSAVYVGLIVLGIIFWLAAIFMVISYQANTNRLPDVLLMRLLIGWVVLIPSWSGLIYLKLYAQDGVVLLLLLMMLVWCADTMAYFFGKKWGKHSLASRISPGKTWEGTIAGFIMSITITTCCFVVLGITDIDIWPLVMMIAIVAGMSVFGDLMESILKREAGLKDSGVMLPGHGGFLDRIDSLTAAAPLFAGGLIYYGY